MHLQLRPIFEEAIDAGRLAMCVRCEQTKYLCAECRRCYQCHALEGHPAPRQGVSYATTETQKPAVSMPIQRPDELQAGQDRA